MSIAAAGDDSLVRVLGEDARERESIATACPHGIRPILDIVSTTTANRTELGAFLRARRGEVPPAEESLGARRVPGLRREEVAERAYISVDYYKRLEQARAPVSVGVLDALADVLRLNAEQRAYMFTLAGKLEPGSREKEFTTSVVPRLQRVLDQLVETPAIILGPYLDVLAWNHLAQRVISDFSILRPEQRNLVRIMFLYPAMRERYVHWEHEARIAVANLRMDAARRPGHARLETIVAELESDPLFRRLWKAQYVDIRRSGHKEVYLTATGLLSLEWDTFAYSDSPAQQLIVLTAEPNSPSLAALQALAGQV
ncbi:Helix-turn-helix domain-containing protein [Rhodococcus jostii]|uniref:Helix-turn-helix domain-containing protein n=1 Tax=Rhodococcus jostii TaxID=132919 RepID=A0A1H5EXT4_RHOJO|nr:Helix-turn-helix domain-containing protein [Rhodococcus jostii]